MNETKQYQRFRSRIEYIDQHLETVDAALTALKNAADATIPKTLTIAEMVGERNRYSTLNKPVADASRVIAYSRSINVEYAIVFLYRCFSEYLKGLLTELYATNPFQVTGLASPKRQISFPDVVKLGSYEKIAEHMVETAFRDLENKRSSKDLLVGIISKFNFDVSEPLIDGALMYFEIRHLVIHNDCVADEKFVNSYGENLKVKVGDKLPRKFRLANDAKDSIVKLAKAIDSEAIKLIASASENPANNSMESTEPAAPAL